MKKLDREIIKEDGSKVEIYIRKPTNGELTKAEKVRVKQWSKFKSDPDIMSKIQLNRYLEERGIWDKSKENDKKKLEKEISELQERLSKPGKKKVKLSEARNTAIELRKKRIEYRELISEKIELESNTTESLADNARFDFLVTCCTFYKDGDEKVYNTIGDYENDSTDTAFTAAAALGQLLYNLTDSFEATLPENEFLIKQKLADENNLALTDFDGNYVDEDFNVILKKEELNAKAPEIEYENDLRPAAKKSPVRKTTKTKSISDS
jgi:hypothetical protein